MAKKMLLMLVLMAVFALSPLACGGDDTEDVDGDTADGDAVDGDDPTDGDVVDGDDPTDGDVVDGDDPTDGDMMDGDMTDGDMTDGDMMDGDMTDGDMTDGDFDFDFDFDFEMEDNCMEMTATYGNIVYEFGSNPYEAVEGAIVTALWNHNGEEIDGVDPVTVGANGLFQFVDLPMCSDGKVAFKIEGPADPGAFCTTYMYEINKDIPDFPLWAVTKATYVGAPALAGVTVDTAKAIVAGATYWMDPGTRAYSPVPIGCSTVEADPAGGDVRYFGNDGLPTSIANQASVNPLNGRYLIANLDPGETALINKVDGGEVNRTRIVATGGEYVIGIASMMLFGGANPMNCSK